MLLMIVDDVVVDDFIRCKGIKTVLSSGYHAVNSGFQVLYSNLCQWNLGSGFQWLVGIRFP